MPLITCAMTELNEIDNNTTNIELKKLDLDI